MISLEHRNELSRMTYSLSHTDTGIPEGKSFVDLVWDDVNPQVFARVELAWVRECFIADLVKRVGPVGDQFSQEDLFIRVDGIDNEGKELGDFGLELESFGGHCCGVDG